MKWEAGVVRIALILSILGAAMALAGCDQQALLEKLASPAEQATAKDYIDQLRRHEFGEIEAAADPSIAGPSLESTLEKMAALMPAGEPTSVTLVGAFRFASSAKGTIVRLTFEYRFPKRNVIAILESKTKDGKVSIVGFRVAPVTESLESQNQFKWAGKSVSQYAVLVYGIAAALFTVVVLVVAVRTKMQLDDGSVGLHPSIRAAVQSFSRRDVYGSLDHLGLCADRRHLVSAAPG